MILKMFSIFGIAFKLVTLPAITK